MTIDEIRQVLNKADLMLRPNILFVNPSDAKIIRDAIPNIDRKIIIEESNYIETGKSYLMGRRSLGIWAESEET
jgi:hypothetical protein